MTDTVDYIGTMKQALEAARLLGITQAKKGFGCYTQEDARFEQAMHEALDKHTAALRLAIEQAERQEPVTNQREHLTDGTLCWCEPELDYVDPDTGAQVWVHREMQ